MAPGSGQDSSRPVIGVTGNSKIFSPSWLCIHLGVALAGGRAVRISTRHRVDIGTLNGLIISGGDDIHPSLYGGKESEKARYDTARDHLEKEHINHAMAHDVPLLGICRGYQLINVVAGGSLFDDIHHMRTENGNFNTILPKRQTRMRDESRLRSILGQGEFKVNSLHHQAIDKLGKDFIVAGCDDDDIIQAIEHTGDRAVMGVQWHPEYMVYLSLQRKLFSWIVQAARLNNSNF